MATIRKAWRYTRGIQWLYIFGTTNATTLATGRDHRWRKTLPRLFLPHNCVSQLFVGLAATRWIHTAHGFFPLLCPRCRFRRRERNPTQMWDRSIIRLQGTTYRMTMHQRVGRKPVYRKLLPMGQPEWPASMRSFTIRQPSGGNVGRMHIMQWDVLLRHNLWLRRAWFFFFFFSLSSLQHISEVTAMKYRLVF